MNFYQSTRAFAGVVQSFLRTLIYSTLIISMQAALIPAYGQIPSSWPTKPVKIVLGLGAGSSMDSIARILAPKLSETWGQPVVIENRVGAAGNIAAGYVVNADDNHTFLIAQNAITVSASLYPKIAYKLKTDLKPVSQITSMPHVIVTSPKVQVKTLSDLISLAKKQPNKLNYSSAGIGNADHMAAELMNSKANISMTHIPYTGGSQAISAVISGDVQMYFPGLPTSLPHIKSGNVIALAVTSTKRSPALPDVPTVSEAGIPGYSTILWYGLFAPASMQNSVINKISLDINKVLNSSEIQAKLTGLGIDPAGSTPENFTAFINSEIDMWETIVKSRNIRAE